MFQTVAEYAKTRRNSHMDNEFLISDSYGEQVAHFFSDLTHWSGSVQTIMLGR
jgi:hypothetical protein